MFWTHLNPLKSPKPPRKSKKVIFRGLKIRARVQKVALKYFLLVLGQKIFRRPLPYLHAGKVSSWCWCLVTDFHLTQCRAPNWMTVCPTSRDSSNHSFILPFDDYVIYRQPQKYNMNSSSWDPKFYCPTEDWQ